MEIDPDLVSARKDDPDGIKCYHCGKINDFADDCGWFYFKKKVHGEYGAGCESCYEQAILNNVISRGDR